MPEGKKTFIKWLLENLDNFLSLCARGYFFELYKIVVEIDQFIDKYGPDSLSGKNSCGLQKTFENTRLSMFNATEIIAHAGNAITI